MVPERPYWKIEVRVWVVPVRSSLKIEACLWLTPAEDRGPSPIVAAPIFQSGYACLEFQN